MSDPQDEETADLFAAELDGLDIVATAADDRPGYRKSSAYDLEGRPMGGNHGDHDRGRDWPDDAV